MENVLLPLLNEADKVVLGKSQQIKLAVSCILAKGHLLIEDIPGVGKTTLSHTLAKTLGLNYQRIQFTNDILPADIIGSSIYNPDKNDFEFKSGPIFNQIILADEINRSPPKSQSALLEAMEEHQVTVEGHVYPLPDPFFVIATQNPSNQIGTFPLPESQLDRFLMRIELGYPNQQAERELLTGINRHQMIDHIIEQLPADQLTLLQSKALQTYTSDALLDYVQAIIAYSRNSGHYHCGLSPRAGIALLSAAKAWAFLHGRDSVLPDDVQDVLPAVAGHRLRASSNDSESIVAPILNDIEIN